jgi:undecaprenyl phosphate N,N'-diacetylbacillosamine 1-phosphate transferase
MYKSVGKRCLDIVIALSVLLITSPVFLLVALVLIWVNNGSPFFLQDRPGFRERKITIIKFKSMLDLKDDVGKLLPDNARMTSWGKWIRKLSIDELPQLINVLKGDMSLVGPRPLLFKYLPLYTPEQRRRHDVKPGITGWAQVNGRNSISWTDRFKYDVYYVDRISFMFDLKIILKTILKVVKSEGVNQSNERPMQPFNGTN